MYWAKSKAVLGFRHQLHGAAPACIGKLKRKHRREIVSEALQASLHRFWFGRHSLPRYNLGQHVSCAGRTLDDDL
eukprot:scaffold70994_cov19-Prasinocladus_malaysianus.AAC.1